MAKNRHASGTPRPDLAVVSADTRHARHGRAKASVKRKRQVRPARERPRRSPRPRWRGRMPSQSALELRSEHWSARARGRHDRDEIVTLLWQRVPAGADNSRRDWSGTPPAAAGSRGHQQMLFVENTGVVLRLEWPVAFEAPRTRRLRLERGAVARSRENWAARDQRVRPFPRCAPATSDVRRARGSPSPRRRCWRRARDRVPRRSYRGSPPYECARGCRPTLIRRRHRGESAPSRADASGPPATSRSD